MTFYNPNQARRKLVNIKNIQTAVLTQTPKISLIAKTYGDNKAENYIKIWLLDLNQSLDVKNPLSGKQIDDIAFYMVNDFRNISIADLFVIFSDVKKGVYGSMYESLSTDKVLGWVGKYNAERDIICAENSYQKHLQTKEPRHEPRNSEMTIKEFLKPKP